MSWVADCTRRRRGTPPSSWPDLHGFVGGYRETTGLTHLGARDYDPLSGRFLTADPILNTGNPQAWNAYSYSNVNNSELKVLGRPSIMTSMGTGVRC
ncbi:RHS repeat-associated core domain-containing protein [Amycolatopsis mediterranei]|uniref:RHS repeat-associated core domain-containing protein n=1 Tax=Amycolatopsis mediterranei TaxID=33910 RepID=UPI003431A3D4